ncbi:MAG: 3-deoxy-manno-octulosonate cytidylyltransferase [Candidatus Competibacteraceae bacterium]|jgi:3-deoxy-manno-octulosonate cytidylyltransferase (CMP-KDO synthetase)|nr:3-deoxy-manno-octulosonate cytidylyltransferase [Candidatus Competibacteraceae bacterium]
MNLDFRVAIPARHASTRLPGKPLRILAGAPLIEHVYRNALASGASEVIIATDDERIRTVAEEFGATVCLTSGNHASGTDRLAELVERQGWADDDIVVNLQGDEPLIAPTLIRQVAMGLAEHPTAALATLHTRIETLHELFDPHVVKVVTDGQGYALYFSRAPIPYHRAAFCDNGEPTRLPDDTAYLRHIGLYAYRVATLRLYPQLPACAAEKAESLEQLRALWNGMRIFVEAAAEIPPAGVDTEEDLARVEALLAASY